MQSEEIMFQAGRDKGDVNKKITLRPTNGNPRDLDRKLLMGGSARRRETACQMRTNERSTCEELR